MLGRLKMAININIGPDDAEQKDDGVVNIKINKKPEQPVHTKMSLQARKTLDGNIIVTDHPDIDIVIMPTKMKVVSFAKKSMDDTIYATQSRLFEFLYRKGIVALESVKGGNVYSSLEGTILTPEKEIPVDEITLFSVGKFIEDERPGFMYQQAVEDHEEKMFLEPDTEDSTELGEVPHAAQKGSILPHQVRRYIQGL